MSAAGSLALFLTTKLSVPNPSSPSNWQSPVTTLLPSLAASTSTNSQAGAVGLEPVRFEQEHVVAAHLPVLGIFAAVGIAVGPGEVERLRNGRRHDEQRQAGKQKPQTPRQKRHTPAGIPLRSTLRGATTCFHLDSARLSGAIGLAADELARGPAWP